MALFFFFFLCSGGKIGEEAFQSRRKYYHSVVPLQKNLGRSENVFVWSEKVSPFPRAPLVGAQECPKLPPFPHEAAPVIREQHFLQIKVLTRRLLLAGDRQTEPRRQQVRALRAAPLAGGGELAQEADCGVAQAERVKRTLQDIVVATLNMHTNL